MFFTVKYVGNSQKKNGITSKTKKKKKIKAFKKKTCSKFTKVYYLQNYICYDTFCYYHC